MPAMHALRTSFPLARLVLAWFVLALGVAVLSPLVHPQATELVCSDGGRLKLVAMDADADGGGAALAHAALDCAACLGVSPAPDAQRPLPLHRVPAERPTMGAGSAVVATPAGGPLPPRGPPALA